MSTARYEMPPEMLRKVGLEPQGVYDVYDVYDVSRELPSPPEFPVDAMPAGCRMLIREASEAIGCPAEFVALPMLAVLATAIGNSRVLELKPGWEEKAVVFATVIGDPATKKSPGAKLATKPAKRLQVELRCTGGLCLVLAMARAVVENTPEQVEPRDVVAAMVLIDYFKHMARRVYAAVRDANPLDGLAEDLARFLELQGSEWSGEPSELHSQLKSHHKPNRVNEFGKMVRAAVKRQRGLTFDDGHERVIRPDGNASTRRVMKLKLIEMS